MGKAKVVMLYLRKIIVDMHLKNKMSQSAIAHTLNVSKKMVYNAIKH